MHVNQRYDNTFPYLAAERVRFPTLQGWAPARSPEQYVYGSDAKAIKRAQFRSGRVAAKSTQMSTNA